MIKTLKEWKKLVVTENRLMAVSVLTNVVILVCAITEPIALSSFISNASVHSTTLALIWLAINLGLIIMEHIAWHINYSNYTGLISGTYISLQRKVSESVLLTKEKKVDNVKLDYCINSDIFGVATFLDTIILRTASLIKFIVLLVIIFCYSYVVGVMLVIMSAVGYSLLLMYNHTKQKSSSIMQANEMATARKTDEIINMSDVINKYNLNSPVLLEQERRLKGYVNSYNTLYSKRSIKDNFIQIYWYTMLSVVFMVCYFEFNNLVLPLSIFLVLIDYSTSFVKLTENAFDFTIEISELDEKVKRINEFLNCGNQDQKADTSVTLSDPQDVKSTEEDTTFNTKSNSPPSIILTISSEKNFLLNDTSTKKIELELNKIYVFQDKKYAEIFNADRIDKFKLIKNGKQLDSLNLVEKFMPVTNENEMFKDNIIENLQIIQNDEEKITKILNSLGAEKLIDSLPQDQIDFASNIENKVLLTLLNITRAVLSDAEIVYIKMEENLSVYSSKIISTLKKYCENKCVLIYDPFQFVKGAGLNFVK